MRDLCRTKTTDMVMVCCGTMQALLSHIAGCASNAFVRLGASLQAGFNASAQMCVRDLRRTETTDINMLYIGTVQALSSLTACGVLTCLETESLHQIFL